MLFDVRIDGASTILDFGDQFSAVIRKGVNHLLQVLEQKFQKFSLLLVFSTADLFSLGRVCYF